MESRTIIKPLVLACSIALAACSGSDVASSATAVSRMSGRATGLAFCGSGIWLRPSPAGVESEIGDANF